MNGRKKKATASSRNALWERRNTAISVRAAPAHMGRNKRERWMTTQFTMDYLKHTFFLFGLRFLFFRNNEGSPGPELPV